MQILLKDYNRRGLSLETPLEGNSQKVLFLAKV